VFIRVKAAALAGAVQSGNLQQMAEANAALNAPLGLAGDGGELPRAQVEPEFLQLGSARGTENRISVARQDCNRREDFNAYIGGSLNLTAKIIGRGKPRGISS
jgi:hypothetical protein